MIGEIRVIVREFSGGSEFSSARKNHSRRTKQAEVFTIDRLNKKARSDVSNIVFTKDETAKLSHPHDDALVVSAIISNFRTR